MQIDKIAPSAPRSFPTDNMIPIGSLQPSSSNFPQNADPNMFGQQAYPGLPHAPTAEQAQKLGPVTTEQQSPINPALMTQPVMHQRTAVPDRFGATPFLPPPPSSHKSSRSGSQGRYQFPPEQQQQAAAALQVQADDRYAAFEIFQSNGFGGGPSPVNNVQQQQQQQGVTTNGANGVQQHPAFPPTSMGMVCFSISTMNIYMYQ